MATKKEKRAAALAKRGTFLAKHRQIGLDALARDRAARAARDEENRARMRESENLSKRVLAIILLHDSLR